MVVVVIFLPLLGYFRSNVHAHPTPTPTHTHTHTHTHIPYLFATFFSSFYSCVRSPICFSLPPPPPPPPPSLLRTCSLLVSGLFVNFFLYFFIVRLFFRCLLLCRFAFLCPPSPLLPLPSPLACSLPPPPPRPPSPSILVYRPFAQLFSPCHLQLTSRQSSGDQTDPSYPLTHTDRYSFLLGA